MSTRQNPLSRFEAFMQRIVEGPFAFLFPSKLQPAEVEKKLVRAMEDNSLLQSGGKHLAPDVYDIYVSIKDHQQLNPIEAKLTKDWQDHLVQYARTHHYVIQANPLLRLHAKRDLRAGAIRIDAQLRTPGEDGATATQAISAEQMAQIRQQLPAGQALPGIDAPLRSPQSGIAPTQYAQVSQPIPTAAPAQALPQAWLTIRSPQTQQTVFRIEKMVVNIGRQLTNDIIVEDKRVSRYHAQIKYQSDGQFTIFDLGSMNGITVNGVPHLRQRLLQSGDHFIIGSYNFVFERR